LAIAKVYLEKGDNDSAIEYLVKSIDIAKNDTNESDLLQIYIEIAYIYKSQNNLKSAFDYYKNSLKLAEKLDDKHLIIKIYDELGILNSMKGNNKKAFEFFQKSYEMGNELNQYYFEFILYHIALLQYLNKNFDDSYEKLQESYKIAERTNNKELLIKVMVKIGDIWKNRNNFDDAIYYYKKILELTKEIERRIIVLYKIGKSYQKMGDLTNADDYLLKAFKELRLLVLSAENIGRKKEILQKFSRIPRMLCILKCILYDKTKDIEFLKEAVGYLEFSRNENVPSELKTNYNNNVECPDRQRNILKITEKFRNLKNLKQQCDLENNFKTKEILKQLNQSGRFVIDHLS
jgi:tetratricopeptide (TPR) repeat protein